MSCNRGPDAPGSPLPRWPGEFVDLGDRTVYVRAARPQASRAEVAVFVHGLGGSSTNWTDLMGELGDRMACYAIDLPGFGLSPAPRDGTYTVDAHASTVAGLIEHLNVGPVHLFGNSLGGAVATRIAAERSHLVRTLTLISPALPHLRARPVSARLPVMLVPYVGPYVMRRVRTWPPERRIQLALSAIYADPTVVHAQRIAEAVEDLRERDGLTYAEAALRGSLRGLLAEYLRRGSRSLWRQAARIQTPTLIIHGRYDRLVDPRTAVRASRVFPVARAVVLPGAGHCAQMECPEVVAREFRALVEELATASNGQVTRKALDTLNALRKSAITQWGRLTRSAGAT